MSTIQLPHQPAPTLNLSETANKIETRIAPLIQHHNSIMATLNSIPNAQYTAASVNDEFIKLINEVNKAQTALNKAYNAIGSYQVKHHLI